MKKEITDKQHRELLDLGYAGGNRIADLIEFLGDDFIEISKHWTEKYIFIVKIQNGDYQEFTDKEIVNALWEAVKFKLAQS